MTRFAFLFVLTVSAHPATAQNASFCQELWLSRNTVMDRAGQCFATPLGQAVFDNSDCVASGARLTPLDAEIVRMAQELEDWAACAVDTQAEHLTPGAAQFHDRLQDLFTVPVRADTEHACYGYSGPRFTLHTGISNSTTVIGIVDEGQEFTLSHQPMRGGWEYIEVYTPEGAIVSHGWTRDMPFDFGNYCAFSAG